MNKAVLLTIGILALVICTFNIQHAMALTGDIFDVNDVKGPFNVGGEDIYRSVVCNAYKKTYKLLGGDCTLTVTKYPTTNKDGDGLCACAFPDKPGDISSKLGL